MPSTLRALCVTVANGGNGGPAGAAARAGVPGLAAAALAPLAGVDADAAAAGSAAATSVMVPGACACSGAVAQLHSSATQAAASTVNGEIGRF